MSKTKLCHQELKDDKDKTSMHKQEFRKKRIILVDTIWELMRNALLKSMDSESNVALTYLKQCKDFLEDCLTSLQDSESDRFTIYSRIVASTADSKTKDTLLGKYLHSLEEVISDYVDSQGDFRDMEHKDAAKQTLEAILVENIGIIQLAIQMLQLLTDKSNNEKDFPNIVEEVDQEVEMPEESISFDETNDEEESESDLLITTYYQRTARSSSRSWSNTISSSNCSRLIGGKGSKSSIDFVNYLKRLRNESQGNATEKHVSISRDASTIGSLRIHTGSLREAASYIIDTLIALKTNVRDSVRCDEYWNDAKLPHGELGDIWLDLCELHNQMLLNPKYSKLDDLRDDLTKWYITKMQILLQESSVKPRQTRKKSIKKTATPSISNSSKLVLRQNVPGEQVISMHKHFYKVQLEKLRGTHTTFNARKFYNLIFSQKVPQTRSERACFSEYGNDPEHYNILILMLNPDSQREHLLECIENNYQEIKSLINREKRHRMIAESTWIIRSHQTDYGEKRVSAPQIKDTQMTFDEEFLQLKRAKWAKYFEEQELTPIERKLAKIRREKQHAVAVQRMLERKRKILQERKVRQAMKSIISLYKSPRLTHRMRKAMEQLAEGESGEDESSSEEKEIEKEPFEREQHPLADAILSSESWTSCCSECHRLQGVKRTPKDSALERFHRTHEDIMALSSYCDYYPV